MAKIKIEITIPSGLKEEPIIYHIVKNYKVIPTIVEASFSTEMGWAILTLEGSREELDRLFTYFKDKNISINPI
ncbi:MAG: hypothetical protein COS99_07325 [Candidatus Omnitrophica bacterium CG07_land_8_20_14_0_80_42_15]|uniref:NIL domain-containing protein n=1 Tax=Candidatus Aquitaenariimonas noxiae TaxID=1974741 RepID=A0A2J0KRB2_9BACT|nr:MAG: hypothetical protein COS99_07325 [Candidatus Omnitrophica bacterium CG07_land_8_20_14_0_80_42_15]